MSEATKTPCPQIQPPPPPGRSHSDVIKGFENNDRGKLIMACGTGKTFTSLRLAERYTVTTDKKSGIVNDPNDWCREHNNPRYIIDLLKRVIRVSLETNRLVATLPPLNELH